MQTLGQLRTQAAELGLSTLDKDRYALISEINQARREQRRVNLQAELLRKGLPATGTLEELELRLVQTETGAVSNNDRKLYYGIAIFSLILGLVGLAISIPHIASALASLMGCPQWVAVLLAITIDGGIVGTKVIETIGEKFSLNKTVKRATTILLVSCLVFSALLNAYEFLKQCHDLPSQIMAVLTAVFLSGFVFFMFMGGAAMITRCTTETEEQESDPIAQLKQELAELREYRSLKVS